MLSDRTICKMRNSCAWIHAYLDCLEEKRPVSVIRTHWQLKGLLI